jgi:hypothetical protein
MNKIQPKTSKVANRQSVFIDVLKNAIIMGIHSIKIIRNINA